MATAVVLVNSASGHDSCGNATLRGTGASTDPTGILVTLTSFTGASNNLSGVAVDGSAWIQLLDATAGARNFSKIIAVDNVLKIVTVDKAFAASLSGKTFAINQTLSSMDHANSRKLIQNNSTTGDIGADAWKIRMQSGHSETLTNGSLVFRTSSLTQEFIFEGDPAASVPPVITGPTTNAAALSFTGVSAANLNVVCQNFKLVGNTAQTKSGTAAHGIITNASPGNLVLRNLEIGGPADNQGFYSGVIQNSATNIYIENVSIKHCYNAGASLGNIAPYVNGLYIDECDHGAGNGDGLILSAGFTVKNLVVARCRGKGVRLTSTGTGSTLGRASIDNFSVYKCGGDGIDAAQTSAQTAMRGLVLSNGTITHNTGIGVNFSGSGMTTDIIAALQYRLDNINYGTGGSANSGDCNLTLDSRIENGKLQVDPAFADPDNATESLRNFTPGTLLKAAGWPSSVYPGTATRSYVDIGGVQRQEPVGVSYAYASVT